MFTLKKNFRTYICGFEVFGATAFLGEIHLFIKSLSKITYGINLKNILNFIRR